MLLQKAGVGGKVIAFCYKGAIQVLRNADRGGGGLSTFPEKALRRRFNVIGVTRGGWMGVQFPGNKRYVTLEWPQMWTSHRWYCMEKKIIIFATVKTSNTFNLHRIFAPGELQCQLFPCNNGILY